MTASASSSLRTALALLAALLVLAAGLAAAQSDRFSHASTRFALTGAHATARCESCHVQGLFKGTPMQCVACHSAGSRTPTATPMPAGHMATTQPWLRSVFGVSGTIAENTWWGISAISAGLWGVPLGFIVIIVVSLLTPAPDKDTQDLVEHVRYPNLAGDTLDTRGT